MYRQPDHVVLAYERQAAALRRRLFWNWSRAAGSALKGIAVASADGLQQLLRNLSRERGKAGPAR